MKTILKAVFPPAILAAIAVIATLASPALAGPNGQPGLGEYISDPAGWDESMNFHLKNWRVDKATVDSFGSDPDPRIQHCVSEALKGLSTNGDALMNGGTMATHVFYPAAEHYREYFIMPQFWDCVHKAGR